VSQFQSPDIPGLDRAARDANFGVTGASPATGVHVLVPKHPRPVGRRRAVAEMTVAAKQVATIAPGHVLVLPAAPAPPPGQAAAPPRSADDPVMSPGRHDTPF
jgi:hypothetical protein